MGSNTKLVIALSFSENEFIIGALTICRCSIKQKNHHTKIENADNALTISCCGMLIFALWQQQHLLVRSKQRLCAVFWAMMPGWCRATKYL